MHRRNEISESCYCIIVIITFVHNYIHLLLESFEGIWIVLYSLQNSVQLV